MKFMKWIPALIMLISCTGGDLTAEDPCQEEYVLTGGHPGEWIVRSGECLPSDSDMQPEDEGGSNNGQPDANGDNSDPGNNQNSDMGTGNNEPANNTHSNNSTSNGDPGNNTSGNNSTPNDMGGPSCEEGCCEETCAPVCEGEQVEGHRIVGILLQLTNPDVPRRKAKRLTRNAMRWVTRDHPCPDLKVLVVRDDNHNGEFKGDVIKIRDWLSSEGYHVTFLEEPDDGLTQGHVAGYDAVWFSNPGYPIDDPKTIRTLEAFVAQGGGLVLSGDDMSRGTANEASTEGLLHLSNHSNGTRTCGLPTDNNQGESYEVAFESGPHPVITGLEDKTFLYANDIDHSTPLDLGEIVLAWGSLDPSLDCECSLKTPVVIAREVAPYCVEFPDDDDERDCEDDDHPREGRGEGHCRNSQNPGHSHHGDD